LDAIINPDAAIVFGYEAWLIIKKMESRSLGYLISENKKNIVLKDIRRSEAFNTVDQITVKKKTNEEPDARSGSEWSY
jgi:hypothetical protein